jgi:hypothetical protein
VARETSAQVGRVAARLRISAVVATFAIIAGVAWATEVTQGLLPLETSKSKSKTLTTGGTEDHGGKHRMMNCIHSPSSV